MTIRHLDLFAGIGGFSRAVHWIGGETVAFVEWEVWNRRVLAKHWPHARFFGDIHDVGADELSGLGRIDLITGGYPCQPFSHAGKRLGTADDRHLWPEMRRVIDLTRPRYVLAENVAGHINMGLDLVLSELEADGYTGRAVVVPAAAVNALHRRDRVWIMAYRDEPNGEARRTDRVGAGEPACTCRCAGRHQTDTDPDSGRRERPTQAVCAGRYAALCLRPSGAVADAWCSEGEPRHDADMLRRRQGQAEQIGLGGSGTAVTIPDTGEGGWRAGERDVLSGESDAIGSGAFMAHAASRGVRRGRASGYERQPAQCGEGAAVGNPHGAGLEGRQLSRERAGERAAGAAGGESQFSDPKSDHRRTSGNGTSVAFDGGGGGERRDGTEAPRSLDAGPHGVPSGLVRRATSRPVVSPRVVGGVATVSRPPARIGHPTEHDRGRSAQALAQDQYLAWANPDVIRAMWADGSWEADLTRVVAEEAERRQKLQAAGNAIVPIVAYEILRVMLGADDA